MNPIVSVQPHFDLVSFSRQLGLQLAMQPEGMGSLQPGTSVRVSSDEGTISREIIITTSEANSPQDVDRIRGVNRAIARDMSKMKGFISHSDFIVGNRVVTITAWENPGDAPAHA